MQDSMTNEAPKAYLNNFDPPRTPQEKAIIVAEYAALPEMIYAACPLLRELHAKDDGHE